MECLLPYLCMVTVPHIMVRLERMLNYRGVGLARFHCIMLMIMMVEFVIVKVFNCIRLLAQYSFILENHPLREIYSFCFFFAFVILFYVGTHLARGYSSGDPRNHYKHTQHNHKQSQQSNPYTHTVWSVAALFFFKLFRGAGLGLNPEHPIALVLHHH